MKSWGAPGAETGTLGLREYCFVPPWRRVTDYRAAQQRRSSTALPGLAKNNSDVMTFGHFCEDHSQSSPAQCLDPAGMLRDEVADLVHG